MGEIDRQAKPQSSKKATLAFRDILCSALILVVGGLLVNWFADLLFTSHAANAANRAALIQMHAELRVGASLAEFQRTFDRHKTSQTKWRKWDDHVDVCIPFEFGAGDWRLRVEMEKDVVRRVLMRTSDGPKPRDAPQDKQ